MRILSRYVFREILVSALLGTVLATFVIFLQGPGKALFELLVRTSARPETVLRLFIYSLPSVLPLTIPFGVLVGILIGLGRMSSDGEITAMRASGISSRTVAPPVIGFAILTAMLAGAASLWLTPLAIRANFKVINKLAAEQLTANVQPRVFEESFPNKVLYVGDVRGGELTEWRNVFMADLTPAEQRNSPGTQPGEGPLVTIARRAIAIPDVARNRIQLSLRDASTHEIGKDGMGYHSSFPKGDQILDAAPPSEVKAKPYSEMSTRELLAFTRTAPAKSQERIEALIELHRRLALPVGCVMLGLVAIPLGISSRKGGKSSGYITAIVLAFFCYHLSFSTLIKMAAQRTLPVPVAAWIPNAAFFLAGIVMLMRLERPGDRDLLGALRSGLGRMAAFAKRIFARTAEAPGFVRRQKPAGSGFLLFQIIDIHVLAEFTFYFVVLLVSFVLMAQIYNFFELLGDVVKNRIPMTRVFTYLIFLAPKLIYDTLPISVLVAVLVSFGILTKNNEITAFKASGVSVRRLALPILLLSGVLSAGLFAFDHYYVPQANRKQDAIRNEIKGRAPQTYLRPDRKWIFGNGSRIFYYKIFDTAENVMVGVNVYELDPATFALTREIGAERAQWQPSLHTWIFQNGWVRDVRGVSETNVRSYQATTFPELDERPDYFLKEVMQYKQMNYLQLQRYIRDLRQSGFDTVPLRVQLYKKFSVPLFALIMAMISIPFGFLVGNRGAMAGIGVSIAIAMAYWGVDKLFEQLGNVNHLPPTVAAWSPDALFGLAGTYLLLRMKS